ncbi:hypothetical protein DCE93_06230 [Agromyces badenianii]|uniref:Uncharacterized protein n=1 Tax=Agromyces badenianii TaxID=2080742 RepID=A0A2S0WVD4_9MICO|nr:hypothetical protein [Agromyces badenianii]AWB95305.1 hypothetical protein DCE93_06230 [Agromyces badenianii]PWC04418.1 hypothetical protein DCE94_09815 [Agromyces badenianii]
MRNDTPLTPETETAPEQHPRRSLRRRRIGRKRLVVAGAIVATGLTVGTGFAVQSALVTQAAIDATAALTDSTGLRAEQLGAYSSIAEARTRYSAQDTITAANATLASVDGKVDSSGLAASVASLGEYERLPLESIVDLTKQTRAETARAEAAAAEFDRVQAEQAAAAAAALAQANTPDGARATARALAESKYGWGESQFQCLDRLWQKESGWSYTAYNASSGATGIPQSLPGSKMASAGADWQSNAATQISWGLDYIARGYGAPCTAWSHSQSVNWY